MLKIAFMGAGSTVFAKSILGDCLCTESLKDAHFALYDIDPQRLRESKMMMANLNANINSGRARITAHCGPQQRKEALRNAAYVVNAIQVGGYKPSTVIDFKIPNKYGLRQTIADTLGIGGIFRALRTIPILQDFARDMDQVCPRALFLNYTNPMAMLTGALFRTGIRTVGLCHSVQGCAEGLLMGLGMRENVKKIQWKVAGINHQGWLLEVTDGGRDLYPEIKKRAAASIARIMARGGARKYSDALRARFKKRNADIRKTPFAIDYSTAHDMIRLSIMLRFGYYLTESSEHSSEYMPYWIKRAHPELIDLYNIPLDEYPRRCVSQIKGWKQRRNELVNDKHLSHQLSYEYGSRIMNAIETDNDGQAPVCIGGNVMNTGLIPNLPPSACVEVPCLVDRTGIQACYVGNLPEQCAALNRTNINVQLLTLEAAFTHRKDYIYQAAMMDPHTAAELSIDEIVALCDDLIKAHGNYLPKYR